VWAGSGSGDGLLACLADTCNLAFNLSFADSSTLLPHPPYPHRIRTDPSMSIPSPTARPGLAIQTSDCCANLCAGTLFHNYSIVLTYTASHMSAIVHRLVFDPPLINSASPWASSLEDLQALYDSHFTGGITTRTATADGFAEDPNIHRVRVDSAA
jgi:hypothetical protein